MLIFLWYLPWCTVAYPCVCVSVTDWSVQWQRHTDGNTLSITREKCIIYIWLIPAIEELWCQNYGWWKWLNYPCLSFALLKNTIWGLKPKPSCSDVTLFTKATVLPAVSPVRSQMWIKAKEHLMPFQTTWKFTLHFHRHLQHIHSLTHLADAHCDHHDLLLLAILQPNGSNLQLITFQTDILSACRNLHSHSLDGEHNTTAAGRKSHRYVATPSHTDRGRGRHQSFTNFFKCERVLVVSAKGGRWSWPEVLNEGRAERRMGGEGPPHHRDPSFWVPHLNPVADTPGRLTRWRQH